MLEFMKTLEITSARNPQYQRWRSFTSTPENPDCPWIALENPKAIVDISQKIQIDLLLHSHESPLVKTLLPRSKKNVRLSASLLKRLSKVVDGGEIIAFFPKPIYTWADVTRRILYLETLQDPGNLGTLFRTAQATGLFTIVTSPGSVSAYNSKAVRASSGALFRVPFLEKINLDALRKHGYHLLALAPSSETDLFSVSPENPTAFLVGNEGAGLSPSAIAASERKISIPTQPGVDSINAAVAGSILMYHIYRRATHHEI